MQSIFIQGLCIASIAAEPLAVGEIKSNIFNPLQSSDVGNAISFTSTVTNLKYSLIPLLAGATAKVMEVMKKCDKVFNKLHLMCGEYKTCQQAWNYRK